MSNASTRVLSLFCLAGALAGCGSGTSPDPGGPTPWRVAGRAVDTQGRPLAGVEIVADNQVLYNSNVVGRTGGDGRYRLELPKAAVTWSVTATVTRPYHGHDYRFALAPDGPALLAGNEGGVVNFAWKLTGRSPEGMAYGGTVLTYRSLENLDLDVRDVELTLTPDGPLVDGSTGTAITGRPDVTADGNAIEDVPIGRYTITARYAPTGGTPAPLLVRIRNTGPYRSAVTADFDAPSGWDLGIYQIEVEVQRP